MKQNVSMFLGATFSLATFWLLLLGITQSSPLKILGGVVCLVGAVLSFRYYREQLQPDSDSDSGEAPR